MAELSARKPVDSGTFRIYAVDFPDGSIGRRSIEDASLLPKDVFNIKNPEPTDLCSWTVIRKANGKYELKVAGDPTGVLDSRLVAFLQDERPAEWNFNQAITTTHKPGWLIQLDSGDGWSTVEPREFPADPVKVHALPATLSDPPQYFPGSVFEFERK